MWLLQLIPSVPQDNLDLSPGQAVRGEQRAAPTGCGGGSVCASHTLGGVRVHPQGMEVQRLDLRILEVFSNPNDSVILERSALEREQLCRQQDGLCVPVPGEQRRGAGRGAYK